MVVSSTFHVKVALKILHGVHVSLLDCVKVCCCEASELLNCTIHLKRRCLASLVEEECLGYFAGDDYDGNDVIVATPHLLLTHFIWCLSLTNAALSSSAVFLVVMVKNSLFSFRLKCHHR